MAQIMRPSDGYRRTAHASKSLAGLKPATSSLQQGFASSSRLQRSTRTEDASTAATMRHASSDGERQRRMYQMQAAHE
jgi:hypothetical protein